MTDREVVLRKLTALREHAARLERRRPPTAESFRDDVDLQDATAMSLVVAVQVAMDIALHMAADEGWGLPASYAESFDLLATNHVLDPATARQMAAMAALRNRIAHGYATVDFARIWSELPAGIDAMRDFAAAIATALERAG